MNKKKNQGYQKTHQSITDCFLLLLETKEVSQITVREICERVDINRSTFYAHFQDIYAVMEEINEQLNQELIQHYSLVESQAETQIETQVEAQTETAVPEEWNFIEARYLAPLLHHLKQHRRFYQAMLRNTNNPALRNSMELLQTQIAQPLLEEFQVDSRSGSYYFNFMKAGFLTIIQQWLEEGCPEAPEQMAELLINLNPLYYRLLTAHYCK